MSDLPNDSYGHTVAMTTDGVTDTYFVGGSSTYAFSAGTSQQYVYLYIAIQWNLALSQSALQAYIEQRYSLPIRFNLMAIYTSAVTSGLTARAAYVSQLFTWATSITSYSSQYIASIKAMTDPSVVAATNPDFSSAMADPLVSPIAAVQILN